MEGDDVKPEPSEPITFGELFAGLCPQYMAMGMTYDQFWHGNTACHKAYREAQALKMRQEEWARWRQGEYAYNALLCVASTIGASFSKGSHKPVNYPEEPYPLTVTEAKERERQRELENTKQFIAQLEAESERNIKRIKAKKGASEDA